MLSRSVVASMNGLHFIPEQGVRAEPVTADAQRRWHATIVASAEVTYHANKRIALRLTNEQRDWLRVRGLAGGIELRIDRLHKARKDWHTRPL